jgi:membrane protein implicated in regulation of membrane protease activity
MNQGSDMDMNQATAWWIACGALVAVELATGTFYLLMLALGCAAGALAAHLGAGHTQQILAAALVGGAAVIIWHKLRPGGKPGALASHDGNLDIGQIVNVEHWAADASAEVLYRGANWQARFAGQGKPHTGHFAIQAIEGSCLILDSVETQQEK